MTVCGLSNNFSVKVYYLAGAKAIGDQWKTNEFAADSASSSVDFYQALRLTLLCTQVTASLAQI